MKPLAIIGLDPGTTASYVVLGLDGQVMASAAAKNLPLSAIITAVMEVCQPLIVSTDKAKVPSLVEDFSRKLGTEIVAPAEDLTRREKRQLLQEQQQEQERQEQQQPYYKSHHQQDSLAAALFAYKRASPTLQKIKRYVAEHQLQPQEQEFTAIALKEKLNFALIRELLTGPSGTGGTSTEQTSAEQTIIRSVIQENKITKKDFLSLYQKLRELQEQKGLLERKLIELQASLAERQQQLSVSRTSKARVDQKIKQLFQFKESRLQQFHRQGQQQQQTINQLRNEIQELQRFIALLPRGTLIKKLKTLSQAEFEGKKSILGLGEGDVLFVHNTSIYSPQVLAALRDKNILLLSPRRVSLPVREALSGVEFLEPFQKENEYFALVDPDVLQNYRQRLKIDSLVQEYRLRRKL